ncbi:unnamed protein product [Sympodiomycopsis kandeliae]
MKFAHALLFAVLLAVSMQVIDAKKCKAKNTSAMSNKVSTHESYTKDQSSSSNSGKKHNKHHNNSSKSDSSSATKSAASDKAQSSSSSGKQVSVDGMTPNGIKAGVSGGQSVKFLGDKIGAWNDWGAAGGSDHSSSSAMYIPMLWGNGDDSAKTGLDNQPNSKRLADFKKLEVGKYKYIMGFNEFDFHGTGSSGKMDVNSAASMWDELMTKHKNAGSKLISPSCALQKDEKMLRPFIDAVKTKPDCVAVHIFQNSIEGVKGVLDHYKQKYSDIGCIWVTEVAFANYQNGAHNYGSVGETDNLMKQYVQLFENDDMVKAYFISDADNGPNGMLTPNHSGSSLSSLGNTFKTAITTYARRSLPHSSRHVRRAAAHSRRSVETPSN